MGLFDSDFQIEKYIRDRVPELTDLSNRELFKKIVGNLTVDLYKHVKDEYDALERRVFEEAPKALQMPDLITCVIPQDKYDLTDADMFPIFAEDLDEVKVDALEMISAVKSGKEFYLYTCMMELDFLELEKLFGGGRRFKGVIQNEYGETFAEFILKPNRRYVRKAEEF